MAMKCLSPSSPPPNPCLNPPLSLDITELPQPNHWMGERDLITGYVECAASNTRKLPSRTFAKVFGEQFNEINHPPCNIYISIHSLSRGAKSTHLQRWKTNHENWLHFSDWLICNNIDFISTNGRRFGRQRCPVYICIDGANNHIHFVCHEFRFGQLTGGPHYLMEYAKSISPSP